MVGLTTGTLNATIAEGTTGPAPHVTWFVDEATLEALSGPDWAFLLSPLTDGLYVTLMLVTALVVVAAFVGGETIGPVRASFQGLHDRLLGYREHVPTILRVTLGLALVLSGTHQAIFLPNVPGAALANLQVVLGFCLVTGIMVRFCALATLGIFAYGLLASTYLLGTMETAAAALLVAAYGPKAPAADDLLGTDSQLTRLGLDRLWSRVRDAAPMVLRVALGFSLMWLAVTEKALNPRVAEVVVTDYDLQSLIPVSSAMWVMTVGVIEFAVGLALVLGAFTRTFSIVAFLVLTLSFFYFKEEVAGHVTFFGALIALMAMGAGRMSVDAWIARRSRGVSDTTVPYAAATAAG